MLKNTSFEWTIKPVLTTYLSTRVHHTHGTELQACKKIVTNTDWHLSPKDFINFHLRDRRPTSVENQLCTKFYLKTSNGVPLERSLSPAIFEILGSSGGGTCTRYKNRALGDTFLKFGVELEQVMRFSKTTGYKLTHAAGGCSCEKNKTANDGHQIRHARLLWIVSSSIIPILCYFWVWGMVVDALCSMS